MRRTCLVAAALAIAAPAPAQTFTFERTLPVTAASALDIVTEQCSADR